MASSNDNLPPEFAQRAQQGGIVVTDIPKLDLESYIQNYKGRTRLDRLLTIARTSTVLSVDALKLVIHEVTSRGRDVQTYRDAYELLRLLGPDEPEAKYDNVWANETDKANRAETHHLEAELKKYKNNLVKESIRMGNEDLGKHFEKIGELTLAYDAYSKCRADVSTAKHIIEVGMHLARLSFYRRDWSAVTTNVNKMSGLQAEGTTDKSQQTICHILYGIAHLGQGKYPEAARSFLQVDPAVSPAQYDEFASPNDIAVYGGLLALATMSRPELSGVLDNSSFRTYLELEPHIRRAISQFVNGRYSACLSILESYHSDYLLDINLQPHLKHLYTVIRGKCIFHFVQPFSCVTIDNLNAAFSPPGGSIDRELVDMIGNGTLDARIDAIDRVVTITSPNPRAKMQAAALAAAKNYEKEALDRIRRIGIVSADLEVKGKHKNQGSAGVGALQGTGPRWGDGPNEGGLGDYPDTQILGGSSIAISDLIS
ncbi:hypothetical protein J7T55_009222 [Diaporthe amygdali]|uniref:uncharacterized protein n=1 Tax=Phomopsis amygdali TaxID=1214568 RepID=UPI0022FE0F0B|nr:uncharacterized protein J7T55_009222 [Diaporthe amygdali]KAJ0118439.1 hypothetical protein J7T55_009222 [Diaporthe amygdali]